MKDEHVYFLFVTMLAFQLLHVESMDYFLLLQVMSSPRGTIKVMLAIHCLYTLYLYFVKLLHLFL